MLRRSALVAVLLGGGSAAAQEEDVPCESTTLNPRTIAAAPRWEVGSGGALQLVADVTDGTSFDAWMQVGLAGLTAEWTVEDLEPDENGRLVITVSPPPGAFLHAEALNYVTRLLIRVEGTDPSTGLTTRFKAPPAFLAWPDGLEAGPVLWDAAAVAEHAPNGVVSPSVRALLGELGAGIWVQAPIAHATRNVEPDAPDEEEP